MDYETEEQYRAREEAQKRDEEDRCRRDEVEAQRRKQEFTDAALIMLASGILG